jgi:phosphopantothenoylcysteine decarboxylase/phosphopantothenate--cysteine ligase
VDGTKKNPSEPGSQRRVIVGVTGGIACYKVAHVVSRLTQAGVEVSVAMTEAASRFVAPLTFQALSGRPVYASIWDRLGSCDPQHIELARAAHVMLIAPCTMDMLAKLAHGRADDAVSLIAAAVDRKQQALLLAPAMNEVMWNQPATQRNIAQLRADGCQIVEPTEGWQACGTVGKGRLAEPETLIEAVMSALSQAHRS